MTSHRPRPEPVRATAVTPTAVRGVVLAVDPDGGVLVLVEAPSVREDRTPALAAVGDGIPDLVVGDTVAVLDVAGLGPVVVARLRRTMRQAPDGAHAPPDEGRAILSTTATGLAGVGERLPDRLVVDDVDGKPLLDIDRVRRTIVVRAAAGDIRLEAEAGAVHIAARDGVRVSGGAALALSADRIDLSATDLTVAARRVVTAAETIDDTAERITVRAGKLTQLVSSLITRADSVMQWVRRRLAVNAAAARLNVEGDLDLAGRRASLRAEDDVRINGERINIG